MTTKKNLNITLGFFIITIVIALGFTGLLVISDFQLNLEESVVSSYEVSGEQSVQKIEYALRYGKTLEYFYGIENILEDVRGDFPEINTVQVISNDGKIMYDTQGLVNDAYLPEALQDFSDFRYTSHQGEFHIFLPIRDRYDIWQGSLHIAFPDEVITSRVLEITGELLGYLLIMALMGILILLVLTRYIPFVNSNGKLEGKKFLIVTMVLLSLIQVVFGWLNYNSFKNEYLDIARNNASNISNIISNDVESVLNLGVAQHQLYRLEDYLVDISDNVSEIGLISLISADGEVIYTTDAANDIMSPITNEEQTFDSSMVFSQSIAADREQQRGELQLILSEDYFAQRMRDILLDSTTVLLVSLILMAEIVIFMTILLQWQYDKREYKANYLNKDYIPKPQIDPGAVRMLILLTSSGIFMSISFIPLRMQELYQSFWGLSREVILGLPVSAEMLFTAIAAVLAGKTIDRLGWQISLYTGLGILSAGLFLSFYAPNAITFVLARAFTGAGNGFILLSVRGYINTFLSESKRTKTISDYISGQFVGFIIGTVIGGMLAYRLDYSQVFLVSLGLAFAALLFVLLFIKPSRQTINGQEKGAKKEEHEEANLVDFKESKPPLGTLSFLTNFQVLGFLILCVLPFAITSMFVDYYFPIFAADEGVSTSNVGRAFMLNGIVVAYLGPFLSKYALNKLKARNSLLISGLLMGGSLLLYFGYSTVTAAFLVVILMGVAESVGLVAQNNYLVNLKATNAFGEGEAMGYFVNIRKLGKTVGPMVFGSAVAIGTLGLPLIGAASIFLLVLFVFNSRKARIS